MAIIKKGQLDRIAGIVKRYTDWFIGRLFGPSYVDKPPVNIDEDNLTDLPGSMVTLSFELGLQEATLKDEEWSQLTWDAVKDSQRPLTEVQKLQVQAAEMSAYTQYRRLADDIANGLYDRLAQATRTTVSEAQVRGEIKEQIQAGVAGNRSYRDVAHSLVGELKEQQRNWTRVAATEMHAARQKGVAEAIRSGIDIYQGSDGIDSRVTISLAPDACSDCRRIYSDPAGGKPRIFKLSELMANEGTNYIRPWRANARPVVPPLHPHCLPGYVPVEGTFDAALRTRYEGKIVNFKTSGGRELSITPNHPVLTSQGFIPSGSLEQGMQVVAQSQNVDGVVLPRHNDKNHSPSLIEDVFRSFWMSHPGFRTPSSVDDLHGDARRADGYIDVVGPASELWYRLYSQKIHSLLDPLFVLSNMKNVFHTGFGAFGLRRDRFSSPPFGSPSFSEAFLYSLSIFFRRSPLKTYSFGSASNVDSSLSKPAGEDVASDLLFLADLFKRFSTQVLLDEVVEIRQDDFCGHVYDLQSPYGWMVASDIYISNCFCRMRYVPPGWGWNDEGRFTMINPNEAFSKGDLIPQGEPLSKAVDQEPHSLLHASHATLPTEDYVVGLSGESGMEELNHLIPRLKKLLEMYARDEEIYKRVDRLLAVARGRFHLLYMRSSEGKGGDNA